LLPRLDCIHQMENHYNMQDQAQQRIIFQATFLLGILLFFNTVSAIGQALPKKELDRQAIKSMLGCYEVAFQYTETFAPEIDYEKAYDYTSQAFECAQLVEETEDRIVIQHLLIINDSTIIKHWRQDWIYEETQQFTYHKDNQWNFFELTPEEVKGQWTQKVYQVDDSPRYCGTATWVHVDGRSEWYHKADSPLPRREYTKRSDYNVMKRGNRIIITEEGWLHEQDNDKVIREDGKEDVLLVQEKGYNTYVRKDSEDCQPALDWWAEHQEAWAGVREAWDEIYSSRDALKLHIKVDGKRLYQHLFYNPKLKDSAYVAQILDSYIAEPNETPSPSSDKTK